MVHKPYWPRLLYKPRIRKNGDIRHFFSGTRFAFDYMVRSLELEFSIPLPRKHVERYALEFLSTFKGLARRRLLVVILFTPLHLPSKKFPSRGTLFRVEWQEKFDPIRGEWIDDYDNGVEVIPGRS